MPLAGFCSHYIQTSTQRCSRGRIYIPTCAGLLSIVQPPWSFRRLPPDSKMAWAPNQQPEQGQQAFPNQAMQWFHQVPVFDISREALLDASLPPITFAPPSSTAIHASTYRLAWGELQSHGKNIIKLERTKDLQSLNRNAKEPSTSLSIQVSCGGDPEHTTACGAQAGCENSGLGSKFRNMLAHSKRLAKTRVCGYRQIGSQKVCFISEF